MKKQTSTPAGTCLKGKTVMDYSGKEIYVGTDVHLKDYQVAKVLNGICIGNHRMESNHGKLIEHLQQHYPGATFRCVYESCAWGFTLQRTLQAAGMECIVVHAADVSTTDKEKRRKTDRVIGSVAYCSNGFQSVACFRLRKIEIRPCRGVFKFAEGYQSLKEVTPNLWYISQMPAGL